MNKRHNCAKILMARLSPAEPAGRLPRLSQWRSGWPGSSKSGIRPYFMAIITDKQDRIGLPTVHGKPASVPDGLRVYAIGDIHGRLDLLRTVADMIEANETLARPARSVAIFLGDYIDRGPESRGVVEFLLGWRPRNVETVFLRGNHEDMMLNALQMPDMFHMWAMNGGLATAQSYGVALDPYLSATADMHDVVRRLDDALPPAHRHFLENLPIGLEIGDYLFVHAGV